MTDQTGRWICHLCRWPRWQRGTYAAWMDHWHQHIEEELNG